MTSGMHRVSLPENHWRGRSCGSPCHTVRAAVHLPPHLHSSARFGTERPESCQSTSEDEENAGLRRLAVRLAWRERHDEPRKRFLGESGRRPAAPVAFDDFIEESYADTPPRQLLNTAYGCEDGARPLPESVGVCRGVDCRQKLRQPGGVNVGESLHLFLHSRRQVVVFGCHEADHAHTVVVLEGLAKNFGIYPQAGNGVFDLGP